MAFTIYMSLLVLLWGVIVFRYAKKIYRMNKASTDPRVVDLEYKSLVLVTCFFAAVILFSLWLKYRAERPLLPLPID